MANETNTTAGLYKRNGIWHIDKQIRGRRLRESTGAGSRQEAEQYLARRVEEIRQQKVYGVRPRRTWTDAATRYVEEHTEKRSIDRDIRDLDALEPYIGGMELHLIHEGTLQAFIEARKEQGITSGSVNRSLAIVRRILRLCAEYWRDEQGMTWLESAPMIRNVNWSDKRQPRPISWDEQDHLFSFLPDHLRDACTYAVNTGCREQEICQLRWDWEIVPLGFGGRSVFELPGRLTKNHRSRFVFLNREAQEVIERQRGKHPERVFTFKGRPLNSLGNSSWKRLKEKAGLSDVRFHDLRHTFATRLRSAGVSEEARGELLGHVSKSVTQDYSAATVAEMFKCVDLLPETRDSDSGSAIVLSLNGSRKTPASETKKAAS